MSAYTDACKAGIKRVTDLTNNYAECLEKGQHGMAAIVRGELSAARSYLQGLTDAGDMLIDIDSDIHTKDDDYFLGLID